MDEWQYERAAQFDENARQAAEAAARRAAAPETHPDFDGRHCVEPDCGEPIPLGRLALGRVRCRDCQEQVERARR